MDKLKDFYFRKNVFGVASAEFRWVHGFPIVIESTFLQLFLKTLGASSFLIGIVPALFIFGISCFAVFASYLTRNQITWDFVIIQLLFLKKLFTIRSSLPI